MSKQNETADTPVWPKTIEEFAAYANERIEQKHDYETSAEALADITTAAFNMAASLLGNSGFQASWAALRFYGKAMRVDGPFGILKADQFLYPQYGTPEAKASEWYEEWKPWLAEQARELLAEYPDGPVTRRVEPDGAFGLTEPFDSTSPHPKVYAHWQALAAVSSSYQEEGESK